jgi:hypothetical protein
MEKAGRNVIVLNLGGVLIDWDLRHLCRLVPAATAGLACGRTLRLTSPGSGAPASISVPAARYAHPKRCVDRAVLDIEISEDSDDPHA